MKRQQTKQLEEAKAKLQQMKAELPVKQEPGQEYDSETDLASLAASSKNTQSAVS